MVKLNNYNNWFAWNPTDADAALRQAHLLARSRINMTEGYANRCKLTPEIIKATHPTTKVFRHYTMLVKCDWDNATSLQTPLPIELIDRYNWWLLGADGNKLSEAGNGAMIDLGAPGVREYYLANILTRNALKGYDGITLDYWWPYFPVGMTGGRRPANYPNDTDWYERAWKPFIEYVCDGIRAAGYLVCGNQAGRYGRTEPFIEFHRSLCDSVVYEKWAVGWGGEWLPESEVMANVEAFSADPLEVWTADYGLRSTDTTLLRKTKVALTLYYVALPDDPALRDKRSFNFYGDGKVSWDSLWDIDLGEPVEPRQQRDHKPVWSRKFERGIALVNYSKDAVVFNIGSGYALPDGRALGSTATVGGPDGYVLRKI